VVLLQDGFFGKGHKKTFLSLEWKVGLIDIPQRTLPPLPFQPLGAIIKGDLLNHKAEKAVK
jgi:hypothetical protein